MKPKSILVLAERDRLRSQMAKARDEIATCKTRCGSLQAQRDTLMRACEGAIALINQGGWVTAADRLRGAINIYIAPQGDTDGETSCLLPDA